MYDSPVQGTEIKDFYTHTESNIRGLCKQKFLEAAYGSRSLTVEQAKAILAILEDEKDGE